MPAGTKDFKIQYFITFWLIINIIQGMFMELHVDEAYYWVYSQFLDWGFYDHPPMVAVFIKIGNLLTHSEIGVRLVTIVTNTMSVYLLWKTVEPYAKNAWLFSCLYFSFVIFHVFGFINSPDSPLLFFATLYFYFLSAYLKEEKAKTSTVFLLTIAITGLLYSKYHAVLLLFFTLLAEWKLLKRPSFWLIVLLSTLFYLPHIWWQHQNDYPSIQYHVFERNARKYKISFTTDYLSSLLLVVGPLSGWYLYYIFFKEKATDTFLRILKFIFSGFVVFFLITSFKSYVQAQWILLAFIPLFVVSYIALSKHTISKWFYTLLYITGGLVILLRLALILPIPTIQEIGPVRSFWGHKELANKIHAKANGKYVIYENGFQDPSSYNYYNQNLKAFAYDSRGYRKTQYDYWSIEDSLRNKTVYLARPWSFETIQQDTIQTRLKGTWYGLTIDSVRLYQKVEITCDHVPDTLVQGQSYPIKVQIYNPYDEAISFSNDHQKWPLYFEFGYTQYIWDQGLFTEVADPYRQIEIPSKQKITIDIHIHAPRETGNKLLMFSLRTDPFSGPRNSKKHPVYVTTK